MMSDTGRRLGSATVLATAVLALVATPGAAAFGSLDADVGASVENTAEGVDVAASAAADAAAAGMEKSVEVASDPPAVPAPETGAADLPDVGRSVDPEVSTPDWSPVDAEAGANVDASTAPRSQGEEATTQDAQVADASPSWEEEAALLTGAAVAAGLLAAFSSTLKALAAQSIGAAAPMFSRLERDEVLSNETRREIFEAIKEDPGLCASDVSEAVDAAWGTTVYHLKVLEENHFIVSIKHGRHRRFFENGGTFKDQKEAVATLQNETTADVLATIQKDPGLPQKEIADRVDLSPQALAWHLNRLEDVELLQKERDGRVVRHYASEAPAAAPA